jgi:hypothetical protein
MNTITLLSLHTMNAISGHDNSNHYQPYSKLYHLEQRYYTFNGSLPHKIIASLNMPSLPEADNL